MKKLFSTRSSDNAFSFAMLLLRIGAGGLMFINHGYSKLASFSDKADSFADPFGIGPTATLALAIFAEFFCAIFIVLGLFTRLATIPLIITMLVAFISSHNMNYTSGPGGGEKVLLFLFCFFAILFAGPGKISLDRFIGK